MCYSYLYFFSIFLQARNNYPDHDFSINLFKHAKLWNLISLKQLVYHVKKRKTFYIVWVESNENGKIITDTNSQILWLKMVSTFPGCWNAMKSKILDGKKWKKIVTISFFLVELSFFSLYFLYSVIVNFATQF